MPKTLEFFYDFMSPYSYLASTQVEAVCARTGATLLWRPFLLGAVYKATENAGPLTVPAKALYIKKDVDDWADHYGIPRLVFPEEFPLRVVDALRAVLVAGEQGKAGPFTRAVFIAAWAEGRNISRVEELSALLRSVGMDPGPALERAGSQEIKDALRRNVEEAVSRGAFGAPTFFVGDDMYLGNDRLQFVERALARA